VTRAVGETEGVVEVDKVDGKAVGAAVGFGEGGEEGCSTRPEGLAVGSAVGSADGLAVVVSNVGMLLGTKNGKLVVCTVGFGLGTDEVESTVGIDVGKGEGTAVDGFAVGIGVGEYVTSCTPAPATTAIPEHVDVPIQPSWIR
jgi:hypothetical protein